MAASLLSRSIDAALEATVVGSFTRIGYAVRTQVSDWGAPADGSIAGKHVLLTGGTSGLGRAAALALSSAGAHVTIVGRDEGRTAIAARDVGAHALAADVSDLASVRDLAARSPERIHVLIHNAGVLADEHRTTRDGIELTLATHVMGPFLLTALLQDRLRAAAPARVIWVSSGGMYTQALHTDDLEMSEHDYSGSVAYARAKRAQVVLAALWAMRLRPDVAVHAMHPGWADTPGVARSLPRFHKLLGPLLRTPEQGADTMVWLATSRDGATARPGTIWLDRRPRSAYKVPRQRRADRDEVRKLWNACAERVGVDLPPPL